MNPDDEHCPGSEDGHCECWWDGLECHRCKAPALPHTCQPGHPGPDCAACLDGVPDTREVT